MLDLVQEESNRFSNEFCEKTIEQFEYLKSLDIVKSKRHDSIRRDHQIQFCNLEETNLRETKLASEFFKILKESVDAYVKNYNLENIFSDGLYYKDFLVQRSVAENCESYSTWHCECSTKHQSDRALTYILYLNDDYVGGETQLFYQHKNIKPEKGKLILFPAYFTHMHRGNMIEKGTKYIATGWCFY